MKDPVVPLSVVLLPDVVGFADVPQQIPRAVIVAPPSSVTLPPDEAEKKAKAIVRSLRHKGPWFLISGATNTGTRDLTEAVMRFLEESAPVPRD